MLIAWWLRLKANLVNRIVVFQFPLISFNIKYTIHCKNNRNDVKNTICSLSRKKASDKPIFMKNQKKTSLTQEILWEHDILRTRLFQKR